MANSNNRIKEPETVHHLVSRIAHRVYFLKDEERDEFIDMMRRTAEFCGIKLIGWCIMTNHFHILAYLPQPQALEEDEILRRYGVLKGQSAASALSRTFDKWRREGVSGEKRVREELEKISGRMYDIGSFMKILKQWVTMEYNRRYSHKGTLWESAYYDRVIGLSSSKIAECLGYIHLNPIRAAASDRFDGYFWSSYTAFIRGNQLAEKGMRFVYGENISRDEIVCSHNLDTLRCKTKTTTQWLSFLVLSGKRELHPRFACVFSRELYLHPRPLEGEHWGRSVESSLPIMQNEKRQPLAVFFVS